MFQTYKKLIKLNLDDLALYLAVEGGLFLLIQIIIGCVMYFGRPDTSVTVSCVLFPIVGGFTALIAGITHVSVSFDQALRFGQTRRRALGLTLGLVVFQSAFALALAAVLAAAERFLCPSLWARLAGMNGWAMGNLMPVPEGTMVNGALASNKTLLIEGFTLDWYWWLLIFAAAVMGGLIIGAVVHRFGSKGLWLIWAVFVGPSILVQLIPANVWRTVGWLPPAAAAAVLVCAGFVWSVWSLLHAAVRA